MSVKFSAGDLVYLRSNDGVLMTVDMIDYTLRGSERVSCVWFDANNQLRQGWFLADTLRLYDTTGGTE